MAERIDNITPLRGRPPVYPWAEWMDGSPWRIRRGEDFHVPANSMAAMIRQRAELAGMTVSTRRVEDGQAVEFQFVPRDVAA